MLWLPGEDPFFFPHRPGRMGKHFHDDATALAPYSTAYLRLHAVTTDYGKIVKIGTPIQKLAAILAKWERNQLEGPAYREIYIRIGDAAPKGRPRDAEYRLAKGIDIRTGRGTGRSQTRAVGSSRLRGLHQEAAIADAFIIARVTAHTEWGEAELRNWDRRFATAPLSDNVHTCVDLLDTSDKHLNVTAWCMATPEVRARGREASNGRRNFLIPNERNANDSLSGDDSSASAGLSRNAGSSSVRQPLPRASTPMGNASDLTPDELLAQCPPKIITTPAHLPNDGVPKDQEATAAGQQEDDGEPIDTFPVFQRFNRFLDKVDDEDNDQEDYDEGHYDVEDFPDYIGMPPRQSTALVDVEEDDDQAGEMEMDYVNEDQEGEMEMGYHPNEDDAAAREMDMGNGNDDGLGDGTVTRLLNDVFNAATGDAGPVLFEEAEPQHQDLITLVTPERGPPRSAAPPRQEGLHAQPQPQEQPPSPSPARRPATQLQLERGGFSPWPSPWIVPPPPHRALGHTSTPRREPATLGDGDSGSGFLPYQDHLATPYPYAIGAQPTSFSSSDSSASVSALSLSRSSNRQTSATSFSTGSRSRSGATSSTAATSISLALPLRVSVLQKEKQPQRHALPHSDPEGVSSFSQSQTDTSQSQSAAAAAARRGGTSFSQSFSQTSTSASMSEPAIAAGARAATSVTRPFSVPATPMPAESQQLPFFHPRSRSVPRGGTALSLAPPTPLPQDTEAPEEQQEEGEEGEVAPRPLFRGGPMSPESRRASGRTTSFSLDQDQSPQEAAEAAVDPAREALGHMPLFRLTPEPPARGGTSFSQPRRQVQEIDFAVPAASAAIDASPHHEESQSMVIEELQLQPQPLPQPQPPPARQVAPQPQSRLVPPQPVAANLFRLPPGAPRASRVPVPQQPAAAAAGAGAAQSRIPRPGAATAPVQSRIPRPAAAAAQQSRVPVPSRAAPQTAAPAQSGLATPQGAGAAQPRFAAPQGAGAAQSRFAVPQEPRAAAAAAAARSGLGVPRAGAPAGSQRSGGLTAPQRPAAAGAQPSYAAPTRASAAQSRSPRRRAGASAQQSRFAASQRPGAGAAQSGTSRIPVRSGPSGVPRPRRGGVAPAQPQEEQKHRQQRAPLRPLRQAQHSQPQYEEEHEEEHEQEQQARRRRKRKEAPGQSNLERDLYRMGASDSMAAMLTDVGGASDFMAEGSPVFRRNRMEREKRQRLRRQQEGEEA